MQFKDVYTLIKSDVPEICDGEVVSDPGVGGIKLVYWKRRIRVENVKIGPISITYPTKFYKRVKVTFLRPYKDKWDTQRKRLPRNYWGKKNNPLTNMWIVVERDYTKWSGSMVRFKDQVTDHTFIKNLKSIEESFVIYNQNN